MTAQPPRLLSTSFKIAVGGVPFEARRLMLAPAEVAMVLGVAEPEVLQMVARGELRDIASTDEIRLGPFEVVRLVEQRVAATLLDEWAFVVLVAVVSGSV